MADTSESSDSYSWPMDVILSEVLPRLPAKSIIRFKCVCKTFRDFISSPEFTRLYLSRFLNPDVGRLLILPGPCKIAAYDLDAPNPSAVASSFAWPADDCGIIVIGSCHGLLCIVRHSGFGSLLVLLNPSTRISQDINMPVNGSGRNFGFGFDHQNLDYKVVAVTDLHDKQAAKTRKTLTYSLNSNSWRLVHTSSPDDSILGSNGGVLVSDHLLHWMFWCPSTRKRRIGCFDVCGEEWKDDVLLPPYYYEADVKVLLFDFGVVDGCLYSLFEHKIESKDRFYDACFYDVWVMTEYGVQDSWIQLFSIPFSEQLQGGVIPIAVISGTGQILIRQRHSAKIFWYNCADGVISDAVFHRAPNFYDRRAFICQRSLVSPPGH